MKEQHRYKELDALRGLAALFVVFYHFTMGKEGYNAFLRLGVTGVDLFFIISGFVIFMSLNKISCAADFVFNRVSRLYPTYWAAVLFTFALGTGYAVYKGATLGQQDVWHLLANLTMFQFYLAVPDIDGAYWTMIVEMLFYIFVVLLYRLRCLPYINAICVVLCAAAALVTQFYFGLPLVRSIIYWVPLLQFLPLFFAGIVFYKLYHSKGHSLLHYFLLVFCLCCQFGLARCSGRLNAHLTWAEYNAMLTFYFVLFTLFVHFKLSFIVNKVTLFFGKISFALYLTHQTISLSFIIPMCNGVWGIPFWVVVLFINLPIIVGIATFITYKIEIPYSRKMKEHLLGLKLA